MRRFEFADEVRQTLARERFGHPDPRVHRRMELLWLKSHGETHPQIAELAGVSRRTGQRVLDLHVAGGLVAVRSFHEHLNQSVPTQQCSARRMMGTRIGGRAMGIHAARVAW